MCQESPFSYNVHFISSSLPWTSSTKIFPGATTLQGWGNKSLADRLWGQLDSWPCLLSHASFLLAWKMRYFSMYAGEAQFPKYYITQNHSQKVFRAALATLARPGVSAYSGSLWLSGLLSIFKKDFYYTEKHSFSICSCLQLIKT